MGAAAKCTELSSQAIGLFQVSHGYASAAVTAASVAAALVPFEMSFGCLLAKGDSKNFVIEWLVVFKYWMDMAYLATVVAFRG